MGWLSGYSKRKAITLTGGADGAQTDFQLSLAVAKAAAMQGDFDDLRFTQADGTTLIDAWAEVIVTDTSATVWVEFPTTPANTVEQTYFMYYGNVGAVSDWDGVATFNFFDDFEGYVDGSDLTGQGGWTGYGATHVISTDVAHSGANSAKGAATAADYHLCPLTDKGVFMVFLRQPSTSDLGYIYIADSSWPADLSISLFNDGHIKYFDSGGSWANLPTDTIYNANEWYKLEFAYDAANNKYPFIKVNGVTKGTDVNSVGISSASYLGLRTYTAAVYFDDVCVRKYAANPPTYVFGAEESAPTGGNPFWYYQMLKRRNN